MCYTVDRNLSFTGETDVTASARITQNVRAKIEASGLSQEQLGQVMTYLLETYLHVEQTKEFIQVTAHDQPKRKARKAGSAKHLGIIIADNFDEPLEDFAEYMS